MASNVWTQTNIANFFKPTTESVWDLIDSAANNFDNLQNIEYSGYPSQVERNKIIAEEIAELVIKLNLSMSFIGYDLEDEVSKRMVRYCQKR